MTFANIYCHMGYHTQTCKPCSHTTHIRKLLQVAVAIINAASMQKTTWVTNRVVSFQKQFHPIKWNKSEKNPTKPYRTSEYHLISICLLVLSSTFSCDLKNLNGGHCKICDTAGMLGYQTNDTLQQLEYLPASLHLDSLVSILIVPNLQKQHHQKCHRHQSTNQ